MHNLHMSSLFQHMSYGTLQHSQYKNWQKFLKYISDMSDSGNAQFDDVTQIDRSSGYLCHQVISIHDIDNVG